MQTLHLRYICSYNCFSTLSHDLTLNTFAADSIANGVPILRPAHCARKLIQRHTFMCLAPNFAKVIVPKEWSLRNATSDHSLYEGMKASRKNCPNMQLILTSKWHDTCLYSTARKLVLKNLIIEDGWGSLCQNNGTITRHPDSGGRGGGGFSTMWVSLADAVICSGRCSCTWPIAYCNGQELKIEHSYYHQASLQQTPADMNVIVTSNNMF